MLLTGDIVQENCDQNIGMIWLNYEFRDGFVNDFLIGHKKQEMGFWIGGKRQKLRGT